MKGSSCQPFCQSIKTRGGSRRGTLIYYLVIIFAENYMKNIGLREGLASLGPLPSGSATDGAQEIAIPRRKRRHQPKYNLTA